MGTRLWREGGAGRSRLHTVLRVVAALALLLFLTTVATPAVPAAEDLANLVVNGSFEEPVLPEGGFRHDLPSIEGWTPDDRGAPIEVQRRANGTPGEGAQLVELDSQRSGGIQQTLTTEPGERYLLKFLASPRPRSAAPQNRLEVIWDGKPIDVPFELGEGFQDTDWTPIHRILAATQARTTLVFRDVGTPSDSLGTYLDDVVVSELTEDVTAQSEGIPGIEVVTRDTADDGLLNKEVSVACPAGKTPIGGGAQVLGNIGHVFLKGSERVDTGWTAQAGALGSNPWRLRAQAICVPASIARARELQVVTADSADNIDPGKEISATCPPGKWAIAGGARVLGKTGRVFLQRSLRERDNRWTARAGSAGEEISWRLRAQALCLPRSVVLSGGLQVGTADSLNDTTADKGVTATCATGKISVAGGGEVLGNRDRVFLQWTLREGDNAWISQAESVDDPTGAPWRVRAQAICLSSLAPLPPNAANDSFSVVEDLPLPQGRPGVLGNDTDPGGESLSAALASGPAHGTVRLRPDGSFTYTPAADYNGPDAFTYRARNASGLTSGIATVSLAVSGINDSPTAVNDAAATPVGVPVTVPVTANDKDVDGDALTAKVRLTPSSGTLGCSGGSCTYSPAAGFTGRDSFSYTVEDGRGGSANARVAVTVAPPGTPVAVDDTATTVEATAVTVPVLANDVPGDPPTRVSASPPSQGTVVVGADNVLTFTPAAGVQGDVDFPYTITDGDGQTSSARVRIEVVRRIAAEVPPGAPAGGPGQESTTTTTIPGTPSAEAAATTTTSIAAAGTENLPPGGGNKRRSVISRSVATPAEVRLDVKTIASHAAVGGLLILLIGFPADLFNKAVEENYDQLRERFRRIPGMAAILNASSSMLSFVAFLVVAALLYGLLDPSFGLNQAGLVLVIGLFVAIVVSTLAFEVPIGVYTRRVAREQVFLRTYPGILAVAAVCVVISRLANFHPGYCYGLIAGYAMARGRQLSRTDDGRSVAIASFSLLAVSLLAWFAWTPVAAAAEDSTNMGLLVADSALSTTFVMGVEGLLFALIPLEFLDGSKLARWRRPLWLVLYGAVVLVFVHTVLDPRAQYLRPSSRGALAGVLFLFVAFGVVSIVVWAYVRHFSRQGDPAAAK